MGMRNMIGLHVRPCQHKNTPVRINMVYSTLRIILRNDYEHVLPIRCPGKKMQNSTYSKVIVCYIAVRIRIPVLRSW